jgi:hypothetical protein
MLYHRGPENTEQFLYALYFLGGLCQGVFVVKVQVIKSSFLSGCGVGVQDAIARYPIFRIPA